MIIRQLLLAFLAVGLANTPDNTVRASGTPPPGGPPANDLCTAVSPVSLASGATLTFTGDNTAATFAGDAVAGSLLDQYPFANTWHAFTTTECSNVTVSYCNTNTGWTTIWKLLTTECPANTVINPATSDQTTCPNGNWTFSFNELPAGTYYLPVPNVGFGQGGGPYSIAVSATACPDFAADLCGDAVPVSLAAGATLTFSGDNTTSTFPGDAVAGSLLDQFPFPNTWHAFTTSECANVTVSYCGTNPGWTTIWKLLTTDCPADSIINASASDQTTCANGNWTFSFSELEAGTYYLPVPNVGFGQGGGPYSIDVSAVACGLSGEDLCADAVAQSLTAGTSLVFTGDNSTATAAGDAVTGSLLDQFPFPNTWHAFTTSECTNVTVSYCGTDSGWSTIWKLLTMDCPADAVINATSSDQTTCANGNWTFNFTELPAGTYYLPVPNVGFGQGGGPYTIDVSAVACPIPAADLCGDAIPQILAAGTGVTFTGDNTTATFPGDAVAGSLLDQFPFPNTWHAFTTLECTNITVNYCGTDSGWSTIWRVLTTVCPADAVINASASDQTACANGNWTFSFNELPAGTYYLPVPNVGFGQGGGPYSIEVNAAACAIPAADLCGDATPLSLADGVTLTFAGDNTTATFAGDAVTGSLLDQFPFANTWHAFTTAECLDVTVNYCNTDSGWSTIWKLLTQVCPADAVINATTSEQTSCANGNWTFRFSELDAGTYYLPVPNVGFGQGGGPYSIDVSAAPCGSTGTEEAALNANWLVYPNPTSGDLTITSLTDAGRVQLDMLDMTGRVVLSEQKQLGLSGSSLVSLGGRIAPGTYVLRIITENGRSEQRVVLK